ncbi:MBOAT family protein [Candidatus Pelagibacter sp.]|nr:MBOAT family protein [Candidatus Pelagibacter sp.]
MLFNSLTYLVLLFSTVFLFWNFTYQLRFYLIFASSLVFYGFWRIEFIILLLFSATINWWIAILIEKNFKMMKKKFLLLSLFINLGILFYFKYSIFFSNNGIGLLNLFGAEIDPILFKVILPLGISFYTFQAISYTIDVYRKIIKPEKSYIVYACYITFFPQLVAGPILRAHEVILQFKKKIFFRWDYIIDGSRRVLYGLFLKVVIADNIAPFVDMGFGSSANMLSGLDVWTLAFLFGFQIYFDFSGYSHIAIGSAKMIGISFPENFNFPYLASSPKDFWGRWHISLSSWVRDYIYLPLSGVKFMNNSIGGLSSVTSGQKDYMPLFITWSLMGLWHGANWTFVLWGIYHAILIFIYRKILIINYKFKLKINNLVGWFFTIPLIMLSWVPFRSDSIKDTFIMWGKIVNPFNYNNLNLHSNIYLITFLLFIGVIITYIFKKKIKKKIIAGTGVTLIGDIILISFLFYTTFISFKSINQFIYFQF